MVVLSRPRPMTLHPLLSERQRQQGCLWLKRHPCPIVLHLVIRQNLIDSIQMQRYGYGGADGPSGAAV